jgi:pimeloyl-ACP methyl ester carboxylesterase
MRQAYFRAIAILLLAVALLPVMASEESIVSAEHWVQNGDVRIYVWEKRQSTANNKKVIVLAHGSATAGKESFDLQVPGYADVSLMDALARVGFDVFALDTRGFGRSTHPDAHMTTAQASSDLNAVVDYVLHLRALEKVDLLAWSWGTQYGGMFVMAHPEKVRKYVSYAQMHLDSPDLAKRRQKIGDYRAHVYVEIPEAGWKPRFYSMAPASDNIPAIVDAYAKAAAAVEKKTPTGPQLDMVTIMPMLNPRLMNASIMLIHGEHDDVADTVGLLPFFQALPNPDKRYVIIPEAGHMMMFQKGRQKFQHAVIDFLDE